MKSKSLIYHVYYGTQGTAGLYLDEIYQILLNKGFRQKVFVSAYYPFSYGEKVYFKYSDITHGVKNRIIRMGIRYFELIYAMMVLLFKTLIDKPKIINFSLLSALYAPELFFLKLVKLFNLSKIVFTCHDVIPFGKVNDAILRKRKNILNLADAYIVHNEYSKNELINTFGILEEKIKYHSFPVMDLRKMHYELPKVKKYDFLFQGVLRPEKGIDILLEAWMLFRKKHPQANLLIAGLARGNVIDFNCFSEANISFNLHYINDFDYCKNIAIAKCVVLPYKRGTNSGIPSSSFSLDCDVIASDIPMFKDNSLINKDFLFKSEDVEGLCNILSKVYELKNVNAVSNKIPLYQSSFEKEIIAVYQDLIN